VLAGDGKKMSKSKGNYPDPMMIASTLGADAVRLYLASSPVVKAEELKFKEEGVKGMVKEVFLPWFNAYRFLVQSITRYENKTQKQWLYDKKFKTKLSYQNPLDLWILAATENLKEYFHQEMGAYRLYTVAPKVLKYLDNLTNWYVKLNRNLLKGDSHNEEEWNNSLNTLFEVLLEVTILMAPLTPFITDSIYLNLRNVIPKDSPLFSESIHFLRLPKPNEKYMNKEIEEKARLMQSSIVLGRLIRDKSKLSFRMPLKKMIIVKDSAVVLKMLKESEYYIKEELNVLDIEYSANEAEFVAYKAIPDFKVLGKRLGS
jgi:isoleucyl-tRNA synthetase